MIHDQFTATDGEVLSRLTQQMGDAGVALNLMETDAWLVKVVRDDLRGEKIAARLGELESQQQSTR